MHEIQLWMYYNMLKLNDDETEFIVFSTRNSAGTFYGQEQISFGDINLFEIHKTHPRI